MVDVVDKATRSRMMSGIRGRDTRPEILLRKALHRLGFRYRLHAKELSGKPDIVLPVSMQQFLFMAASGMDTTANTSSGRLQDLTSGVAKLQQTQRTMHDQLHY